MLFAETSSNAPNLWAVAIVGVLGIVGTLAGASLNVWSARTERKHRRSVTLLQKLENLTCALLDTLDWQNQFQACHSLQQILSCSPLLSCRRVAAIAQIYFPRMRKLTAMYSDELIQHHIWGMHCIQDELEPPLGAQMEMNYHSEYHERAAKIKRIVQELDAAIEYEAQIYLNES